MTNLCCVRARGRVALHLLFVLLGLFGARLSAAEGVWAKSGRVPSVEIEGEQTVLSPNGRRSVVGTRDGLRLDERAGAASVALPVVALPPLWEVNWAPDSLFLAVNASDGGVVGTWDTTIFTLRTDGLVTAFPMSSLIRRAAHTFAKCDSPEEVNVALVAWEKTGVIAHIVAEVPPHSSCRNMGSLRGYRVEVKSERILEVLSEPNLKKRWAEELGLRFSR